MKKIFLLLSLVFVYCDAFAACTYKGDRKLLNLVLSPKITADPSIPVGTVLYSKKYGTGDYKTFSCSKIMNDQYIIDSTTPQVTGVAGLQGKPVYETGIDGIGFQVSDILNSKNGSLTPAVVGSTQIPFENSNDNYQFITVWLIKTKAIIDTDGKSSNPKVSFGANNIMVNDGLLLAATISLNNITYKNTSCNISVSGPNKLILNKIEKSTLMSIPRAGITPSQKNIAMNVDCPTGSQGGTLMYWFNPLGNVSASGDGIIDNMLTGSTAAKNVGIIFKMNNNPVVFHDIDKYKIAHAEAHQTVNITADYYRASNNVADITNGNVKAMMEVVIQEE